MDAHVLEGIAGIWESRMLSERGYQQSKPDRTMRLGYTTDQLRTLPVFHEKVRVWFEGEVLHVEDSCGHGTYRLDLTTEAGESRKLVFLVIEDSCEQRAADWKVPMRWYGPDERLPGQASVGGRRHGQAPASHGGRRPRARWARPTYSYFSASTGASVAARSAG